jgi:hypothetical protein
MEPRRRPLILRRMPPTDSLVIVIRTWRDAGGVRARLLADSGVTRQWVVGSVSDACGVVGLVLSELEEPSRGPVNEQVEGIR